MTQMPGARRLQPPPRPGTATKSQLPPKKTSSGKRAISLVVYGPSGVGKTAFGANWPKAGFFYDPQERGILDLVEYGQCPEPALAMEINSFEKMLSVASDIADRKYDIETAVFDSATGFERLCFMYHCRENFDNDWTKKGFFSYMQGPKNAAKTDWPRFLEALDAIREAGINTILIGHSQVKSFSNPEGSDYDRYLPYLDAETWAQTHRWAQSVLFYNYHVDITKGEEDKSGKKKPKGAERRLIYTVRTAAFDAKNRYGLSPVIDAGDSGKEAYDAFISEYQKCLRGPHGRDS